jgi:hypothetical protein
VHGDDRQASFPAFRRPRCSRGVAEALERVDPSVRRRGSTTSQDATWDRRVVTRAKRNGTDAIGAIRVAESAEEEPRRSLDASGATRIWC